jgi:DNA polymerase-3 subunit delta
VVEEGPTIYIFDGDDEFAINESVDIIRSKLGDAHIAEMNITRLDGRSCTVPQLQDAAATVPFLAPKRMIILTHPVARLKESQQREQFISFLNAEKPTTKLVLVEYVFLTSERERRDGRLNWLEKWAVSPEQEKRVFIRHHQLPNRTKMIDWIQKHAKSIGGQMTPQAAVSLANQIGDDTRMASQEITKLLTYVNFSRPVEADDVDHLTPLTAKLGGFELVNALRDRDGRKAQSVLQRSLEEADPIWIFQSIVSQIRTLLVVHEILEERSTINDIPKSLRIGNYPARLAMESAPRFPLKFLELIFHRLLELDEAIKTGQMDGDLALQLLVIELTT